MNNKYPHTYRLLLPLVVEVEKVSMDDEQPVDDEEEVVCVPEDVVPSEAVEQGVDQPSEAAARGIDEPGEAGELPRLGVAVEALELLELGKVELPLAERSRGERKGDDHERQHH